MSDFSNNRVLGRVLRIRVDKTVKDFVDILGLGQVRLARGEQLCIGQDED